MDAFIVDGLRTPIGKHGGSLAVVRPDDLLAGVMCDLIRRLSFDASEFEDVIVGNTNQAGEDCRNIGRNAALLAGMPHTVAGQTVNRLCGSGLAAIVDAARAADAGDGGIFLAGGVESMSRAPYVMGKAAVAFDRDTRLYDSTIGARFPNPRLTALVGADTMPETADNVAAAIGITREQADAFALLSQQKYSAAKERGFFKGEISPVSIAGPRGTT